MRRSLAFASAAAAACVAATTPLHAQGSAVDQQSACMTGRVGTGVASPCDDGSAVFFSPAGLAMTPSAVSLGVSLIRSGNEFTYNAPFAGNVRSVTREQANIPVPQAYLNYRVNPRLAVGIGAFAPYGLSLEWPVCSVEEIKAAGGGCAGANFEGRFSGYDNGFRGVYIQPTVAYQVIPNRLSVGVGLDYVLGSIEVHQRSAGPAALGLGSTDIADVTLEGSGTGVTGHVGAIVKLAERASFGVRYLHSVEVEMDGDAAFEQVTTGVAGIDALIGAQLPQNQGVSTTIEFPAHVVAGLTYQASDRLSLMGDYQRTYWSSFDQFELDFAGAQPTDTLTLNYRDANTFRFAAEYGATDALALRVGFRYNEAATPRATPLLPEGERNYYTAGIGYRVSPRLTADLAYQYVHQPDRNGAVRPDGPIAGVYSANAQVFGLTLAYRFGNLGR